MSVYVEPNGKLAFVDILNNTWIDLSAINFFTNEYEETVVETNSINV